MKEENFVLGDYVVEVEVPFDFMLDILGFFEGSVYVEFKDKEEDEEGDFVSKVYFETKKDKNIFLELLKMREKINWY